MLEALPGPASSPPSLVHFPGSTNASIYPSRLFSRQVAFNMSSVGIRQKDDLLICPGQWNDFKFCLEPFMNRCYILFLCFSLSHEINTPPFRRQLYLFLHLESAPNPIQKFCVYFPAVGLFYILNFSFLSHCG